MCFSELMMTNYSKKEELEKYIQLINQHCNDLLLIINDILDIAKIESGQASVNIEECRVNDIFSELVAYFTVHQTKIGKPSIKFVANNANNIQFNTDRIKLKQILINLISNAFKFTEQGKIEVSCFVLINNEVQFIVEDTGIGIPDDKQAFVFTRFAQVENSNTRLYRGTGLGLPIVEGLVALLGGVITLQSELGKGSKFIFKLPSNI